MYQFTTTNVINSAYALDYDGNAYLDSTGSSVAKYSATAGVQLNVAKVGTFKTANILSVYKRPYTAAVKEVAQVTVPSITSGLVLRATVDLKVAQSANSEYANYAIDFKKPITVEVLSVANASTDATNLKNAFNALKTRFGSQYFVCSTSSADLIFTAKDSTQRFTSIKLEIEVASPNSIIQPEYTDVTSTTFSVTTAGKVGFGDDNWMARAIMLPTLENTRFFGILKDERPILGGNYSEYVLRYSIDKAESDGIVAEYKSITTHVFYVKSDLVAYFEAAIISAGKGIISIASDQTFALALTGDTTATVSVDVSAIVPFILTNAEITAVSATVGKATIGAITVAAPTGTPPVQTASIVLTKVATGTTVISVTIDGVTKTITATIG